MSGLAAGLTDALAGTSLLAGGVIAWRRHGQRLRAGPLMALAGLAWFAGDIFPALLYAHRGPLIQLLVTYPRGRLGRAAAAVAGLAYVDGLVPSLARVAWLTAALAVAVVALVAWRCLSVRGLERRERAASLPAAVLVCATLAAAPGWAYDLAVAASACGLAIDLRWGRWTQGAITGLVVDLGDEPRALQPALARMLGDPGLRIAYRVGGWVDEAGRPVALPAGETVTYVDGDDGPVAAIVHDCPALSDRELARSIAAAVRLVVANVRMQGEVAARGREVAASRRRLVEAADDERRRLGDELHAGVEQRLAAIAASLHDEPAVARLAQELDGARAELCALAHGIHPRTLTERGLAAALEELANRAAVPVRLFVDAPRCASSQEAAAYFVCSEALANVAKYAGAARVEIAVTRTGGRLRVKVSDDGVGGADPSRGSGLRGLADRIEALGGMLRLESPAHGGTRVTVELPLGVAPADGADRELVLDPPLIGGAA